mmetsp:Transcript_29099/g.58091  ORF Transcript_29099/g.58091 Transcript_29099/m.58091 type:complete len:1347 (+) Transcript_29099:82-4122(+)
MKATYRVRLIDEVEGNSRSIPVRELEDGSPLHLKQKIGSDITAEEHEKNICRERKIFVKAALQLLESHEREAFASIVAPAQDMGEVVGFDVIRSGFLKKGTKSAVPMSAINISSGRNTAGGYVWKDKFVELRHGLLSYYDDEGDETPLVVSSQHSAHVPQQHQNIHAAAAQSPARRVEQLSQGAAGPGHQLHHHHYGPTRVKKTIALLADSCACRIISLDLGEHHGHHHQHRHGAHFWAHAATGPTAPPASISASKSLTSLSVDALHPHSDNESTSGNGRRAFEVSVLGGQRRIFLATSSAECEEWVSAINIAMIGKNSAVWRNALALESKSKNDVSLPEGLGNPDGVSHAPLIRRNSRSAQQLHSDNLSCGSELEGEQQHQQQQQQIGWGSKFGAAGPFARSIARFINWQERLHGISEESEFRDVIRDFADGNICIDVPVAFVKGKSADSRFGVGMLASDSDGGHGGHGGLGGGSSFLKTKYWLGSAHKKAHRRGSESSVQNNNNNKIMLAGRNVLEVVCVEKSQMWKDLQRDEVCVNGERVRGTPSSSFSPCAATAADDSGEGAEGIVGLLVRHMADKVDAAKAAMPKLIRERSKCDSFLHPTIEAILESQIVQCARNILMMCNRTQSGGDTYFCVDSLLNRARGADAAAGMIGNDERLFILAPMSNSADPLEIIVDLVESTREHFFTVGEDVDAIKRCGGDEEEGLGQSVLGGDDHANHSTPFYSVASRSSAAVRDRAQTEEEQEDYIEAMVASACSPDNSESPPARELKSGSIGVGSNMEATVRGRGPTSPGETGNNTATSRLAANSSSQTKGRVSARGLTSSFSKGNQQPGRSPRKVSSIAPVRNADDDGRTKDIQTKQQTDSASTASNSSARASGRRPQLTLSVDDEASNCDSGRAGPRYTQPGVRPNALSIESSSSDSALEKVDDFCDADDENTAGDDVAAGAGAASGIAYAGVSDKANANAGAGGRPPLSMICLSDALEADAEEEGVRCGSSSSGPLTPVGYSGEVAFGRDDNTVISDITFDTSAAFSNNTTLARYQQGQHQYQYHQSNVSGVQETIDQSPRSYDSYLTAEAAQNTPPPSVGKLHLRQKGKSLMKMISSRLTPKPGAKSGAAGGGDGETGGYQASPSRPQRSYTDVPQSTSYTPNTNANTHLDHPPAHPSTSKMGTPRQRAGTTSTFLVTPSGDKEHTFGHYFTGTAKQKVKARRAAALEHLTREDSGDQLSDAERARREALLSQPCFCLRIRVQGVSRYRVCSADPQGEPDLDNWAVVVGTFRQTFLVPACAAAATTSDSSTVAAAGGGSGSASGGDKIDVFGFAKCRLALTERVVSIEAERFLTDT